MKTILITLSMVLLTALKPADKVLICISSSAHKYHKYECSGLKKCTHEIEEVSLTEAIKRGYTACQICY